MGFLSDSGWVWPPTERDSLRGQKIRMCQGQELFGFCTILGDDFPTLNGMPGNPMHYS